jgi:hypothetical protein
MENTMFKFDAQALVLAIAGIAGAIFGFGYLAFVVLYCI